jgi:hemolysin activation/secretion protein
MTTAVLAIAALAATAAQAQPPPPRPPGAQSGEVEQSIQKKQDPTQPKPGSQIQLPPQRPEMKSADDAKVTFKVEKFVITGNKSIPSETLYGVVAGAMGVVGQEMTLAQIKTEADNITRYYRARGFALSWAYVPAQEVKEGVVEIAVVEGRVDKVLVSGNDYYSADFILGHLSGLQSSASLSLDELERGLLTLNDYPGLNVRAILRQGEAAGTTDLYLTAEDKFPVSLSFDFDNFGSDSVGTYRFGSFLEVFNLFDLGHSLNLRGVTALATDEGELASGRVGYDVPFGSGAHLSAFAQRYEYEAKGPISILEPTGDGDVYGLSLGYAFIRRDHMTVRVDAGYEHKNIEQQLLGFTTGDDRLRIATATGSFEWTDDWSGRWIATAQVRQGLGEFANGLAENDPDASRLGADGDFTKYVLTVYRLQKVLDWVHVIGKVHVQYAVDPLVVSEQIAIGGPDSVRGYPAFEFMGDRGYVASAELRVKIPWLSEVPDPMKPDRSLLDLVQLAGFFDIGEGIREEAFAFERDRKVLSGAGVGIRLNQPQWGSVRFDVAWPTSHFAPSTDDDRMYYISVILNLH